MSKAIVVVSFGTTYPETRRKTIEACEQAIQEHFPDYPVHRAFTSNVVRRRIKKQEGLDIPTVKEVLEQLLGAGTQEVYIQPLHVILGSEYEKILAQAKEFESAFKKLVVAKPLLNSQEDYEAVKDILLERYGHKGHDAATVLMGHGSQHYAFTAYAALDHMMKGNSVYIGCVESYPPVELIEQELKKEGVREVHLAPFIKACTCAASITRSMFPPHPSDALVSTPHTILAISSRNICTSSTGLLSIIWFNAGGKNRPLSTVFSLPLRTFPYICHRCPNEAALPSELPDMLVMVVTMPKESATSIRSTLKYVPNWAVSGMSIQSFPYMVAYCIMAILPLACMPTAFPKNTLLSSNSHKRLLGAPGKVASVGIDQMFSVSPVLFG